MNRQWMITVLFVLLPCVAFVGWTQLRSPASVGIHDERERVQNLFARQGAAKAYEVFKAEHQDEDISRAHPAAHIFGEVLYEHEGLRGFPVCDASFGFGCFHSFIGFAIAEHGAGVVKKFDDMCIAAYGTGGLGCVHGIGHGVLAHLGYTNEGLFTALDLCSGLSWTHPYGGCRDGVFMEYNFRTMQGEAEQESRIFSYVSRHAPCDMVPQHSLVACYFSQPAWWEQALRHESDAPTKMLTYCGEVTATSAREACVRGMGYAEAPKHNFSAARGIEYCDGLKGAERARILCREGYAWALWSDEQFRTESARLCIEGLSRESVATCEQEYLFSIQ